MTARNRLGVAGSPGLDTMRRSVPPGERMGRTREVKKLEPAGQESAGQELADQELADQEPADQEPADQEPGSQEPASQEHKLSRLLAAAAQLMAVQGYEQTTIRDVSRETGFSLAGLYYYFRSKEDLLYQIQHRTFASLLEQQSRIAAGSGSAEERFRKLVENHLSFFTENASEMKVCAFELQSLRGDAYEEIEELRRRYYRIMGGVIGELIDADATRRADDAGGVTSDADGRVRHHTLFIFGMLNWTFMWFDPERDGPVERLGRQMADLVLPGLGSGRAAGDRSGGGDDRESR